MGTLPVGVCHKNHRKVSSGSRKIIIRKYKSGGTVICPLKDFSEKYLFGKNTFSGQMKVGGAA